MAKDKKGFILYADQIETFRELPDDVAGRLIKHIYSYVNDEDPETDELVIKIAFGPIKAQLKRDLDKWEGIRAKRSEAGKASAEARRQQKATKSTSVKSVEQTSTKSTVNDNVNVSVSVSDNVNVNDSDIIYLKINELLNSKIWIQSVAMQYNYSQADVEEKLQFFLKELELKDDLHKSIQEIKTHFINTIRNTKKDGKPTEEDGYRDILTR